MLNSGAEFVLAMLNYWVLFRVIEFLDFVHSGILNSREHNAVEGDTLLGPLEKANLNHWTTHD
jgi:hypothetical protein